MRLSSLKVLPSIKALNDIQEGKKLINTVNAYSFCIAQENDIFAKSLSNCDYLIPDGKSIVKACAYLKIEPEITERIAGWDLFTFEMERLNDTGGKCFFMGSNQRVLELIKERAAREYPKIEVETYSPPYKDIFSKEDNDAIISAINAANPDLLWIGMTAPKQEKWAYEHWSKLNIHCHCGTIGAVFDFYAGTVKRAPLWMQRAGLEWFHRFCSNPRRMWRRYLVGNGKFIIFVIKERLSTKRP